MNPKHWTYTEVLHCIEWDGTIDGARGIVANIEKFCSDWRIQSGRYLQSPVNPERRYEWTPFTLILTADTPGEREYGDENLELKPGDFLVCSPDWRPLRVGNAKDDIERFRT